MLDDIRGCFGNVARKVQDRFRYTTGFVLRQVEYRLIDCSHCSLCSRGAPDPSPGSRIVIDRWPRPDVRQPIVVSAGHHSTPPAEAGAASACWRAITSRARATSEQSEENEQTPFCSLAVAARHVVHASASWSRDMGARFWSAVCGRRVL